MCESKLQDNAPRLLNIDSDLCHHVHNSIKSFSKPFKRYVETFIEDVHTDMNILKEICFMLNISYKLSPERILHCWLSFYDCCMTYFELFDVLGILYASWILKDMKNMYACLLTIYLRNVMCQQHRY